MSEVLRRPIVEALDEILGEPLRVLDDGFIRVIDYMGSDESIVQAARVSYGAGTKKVHEDRGLIRYLMRHHHTTPFEMCELKLHIRVPMDCWRQWIRHRTANVNEYSTRYSVAIDAAQQTSPSAWRLQTTSNRQGSVGLLDPVQGEHLSQREKDLHQHARDVYLERLERGISREQARKDLPLSSYTEAYWKIDLHNLLHFLSLRLDDSAQLEIREYATRIAYDVVRRWCPITWEAFTDYRLNSISFSEKEISVVRKLIDGDSAGAADLAITLGLLATSGKRLREQIEFEDKLAMIGLSAVWKI